jgi:hypothetical protein
MPLSFDACIGLQHLETFHLEPHKYTTFGPVKQISKHVLCIRQSMMNQTSLLNYNYLWRQVHHSKGPLGVPPFSSLLDGEELCYSLVNFFIAQRLRRFLYEILLPVLVCRM